MPNTYIDTSTLPHTKVPGAGEFVEVLNNALCGAKNVVGSLRWLKPGTGETQLYRICEALLDTQILLSYAWRDIAVVPARVLPPRRTRRHRFACEDRILDGHEPSISCGFPILKIAEGIQRFPFCSLSVPANATIF